MDLLLEDNITSLTTEDGSTTLLVEGYYNLIKSYPSLMAYWRMDDTGITLQDYSGNGRNGQYRFTGSSTLLGVTENVAGALFGDSDTAVKFSLDGTFSAEYGGAKVTSGMAAITANQDLTLEAWVYPETTDAVDRFVVVLGQKTVAFGANFCINNNVIEVGNSAGATSSGATVTPNQWQHIVVVFNSSGSKVYVNGVQTGSTTVKTSDDTTGKACLGMLSDNDSYFLGRLDEVAVYNSALTAQQVQDNYTAGTTGVLPSDGSGGSPPETYPAYMVFVNTLVRM
jgi:hypothetical protein